MKHVVQFITRCGCTRFQEWGPSRPYREIIVPLMRKAKFYLDPAETLGFYDPVERRVFDYQDERLENGNMLMSYKERQ